MTADATGLADGAHAGLDNVRTASHPSAIDTGRSRLLIAGALFALAFLSIAWRLVDVAVFSQSREPGAPTEAQDGRFKSGRADILDRNGILLATSLRVPSLFADPKLVPDPHAAALALATVLPDLDVADVEAKLSSDRRFVWIRRDLSPREQYQINRLGIPGLDFQRETKRFYPHGRLMTHVVGLAGHDAVGLAGVEKSFDAALRDGDRSLQLAVDIRIQHIVREELERQIDSFNATGGAGVVLDVNTGELIAMVSLPDYAPEEYGDAPEEARFNRAALGIYEMGSTFKIFNTAMALDSGVSNLSSSYDATRPIQIARFTINDDHPKRRWLSVPEIFMYSSNIGSVKMALDVGGDRQRAFMGKLGFLSPVKVELPERGWPMAPSPWRPINTMTIAFGHGIAVSPLHLAGGVASVINGGIRRPVTLIKVPAGTAVPGERVIQQRTSETMRRLLRLVVEQGTGRKAQAEGYLIGGKTGTAEKVGAGGGYRQKALLSSFVAAFPMNRPRYVVLAMIDEPKANAESKGYATGGWVAAPAVKHIVARAAPLLGVLPVDESAPEIRRDLQIELPEPKGRSRLASF
jgi:cell division protein FtsI (penicillin-binding protein 3)